MIVRNTVTSRLLIHKKIKHNGSFSFKMRFLYLFGRAKNFLRNQTELRLFVEGEIFFTFSLPELWAYMMGLKPAPISPSVCPSVCASKHKYLLQQLVDKTQLSSRAPFGRGLGALGFGPDCLRTLVSMATDLFHRVIIGKIL